MAPSPEELSDKEQGSDPIYDRPGNQPSKAPGGSEKKKKAPGRGELGDLEQSAGGVQQGADSSSASGGGFYRPTTGGSTRIHQKWLYRHRKKAFGGGAVAAIISLFLFFFTSGPLQFIHIAQLLQQFHFSAQQDQSNDRSLQELRWLRYKVSGNVQRANLGKFQNFIADRLDTHMRASGIETIYNNGAYGTNLDGFILDPSKNIGKELGIQGSSQADIEKFFKEKYPDVKISFKDPKTGEAFKDGRFFMNTSDYTSMIFSGRFKIAGLNRSFLKASGLNGITSFLGGRIMTKRAGVDLHAITQENIQNKTKGFIDFVKGWVSSAEKGTTTSINKTGELDTSAVDEANAEHIAKTGVSDGVTPVGETVAPDPNGTNTEEGLSLKAKLAGSAAGALFVACTLRTLDDQATSIKEAKVVYPLMREATTIISVGNQVMSGQDLSAQQLGYFKQLLEGPSTVKGGNASTSWYDAASIQAELGHNKSGVNPSSTLTDINKNSPFHFLNSDPVISAALYVPCSTFGTVVSAILAPGSFLLGYVIGQFGFVQHLYDSAAQWIAGKPLNLFDRGADFGNDINFGSRLAANAQAVSGGGRALSSSESSQLALYEAGQSQQDFQSHNLAYQLLNPYDARSALSKFIDQQNPQPGQAVHNVASAFFNFGRALSSLSNLLFSHSHAAATAQYDYGFPKYGFSVDEMNSPLVKNPYQNADTVVNTILPAHPEYIKRVQDCYGVTIDPTTYDVTSLGTTQIDPLVL